MHAINIQVDPRPPFTIKYACTIKRTFVKKDRNTQGDNSNIIRPIGSKANHKRAHPYITSSPLPNNGRKRLATHTAKAIATILFVANIKALLRSIVQHGSGNSSSLRIVTTECVQSLSVFGFIDFTQEFQIFRVKISELPGFNLLQNFLG